MNNNLPKISNREQSMNSLIKRKKYFVFAIIGVLFLLGISYALFSTTLIGQKQYSIKSNGLKIRLDESNTTNNISIEDAIPVTDLEGKKNPAYRFSLINEERQDLAYTIYLKEQEYTNKTPASAIRYHYTRDVDSIMVTRNITESMTEDGRYYLESDIIPSGKTYQYAFWMWIDYRAGNEILNTEYSISIEIEATQTNGHYKETILKGTEPVLSDSLIPVVIGDNGTVKRADLYDEWYSYEKKKWANAVVLEDTAGTYNTGDTIPEDEIESYFVWVPRYKYKIFNDGNYTGLTSLNPAAPQTIEIEFENKDTAPSNGTTKDEWLSHPAFQTFDTNGFWVGKFESGYRGATTTTEAQVTTADATKLIIKPNTYSWRNTTVGNMFKTSYDYLRDNESHMMKNTEWGAVAYLSHSQYGVGTEIYINNNNAYLTGCGGDSASASDIATCTNSYGSKNNGIYNQTTTGNISGIFDMSGGAWEYVMGYNTGASTIGGSSEITVFYEDFFTNSRWDKYYDKYVNASTLLTTYNGRILGDATGEMGPFVTVSESNRSSWYNDYAAFVFSSGPWFNRGGNYYDTAVAGAFNFSCGTGSINGNLSFRLVLAP